MAELSETELNELAIKVAARLESSWTTRLIPKEIQEGLAKAGFGYPMHYQNFIPIGSVGIISEFTMAPDGSFTLRLADMNHQYFWSALLTSDPEHKS